MRQFSAIFARLTWNCCFIAVIICFAEAHVHLASFPSANRSDGRHKDAWAASGRVCTVSPHYQHRQHVIKYALCAAVALRATTTNTHTHSRWAGNLRRLLMASAHAGRRAYYTCTHGGLMRLHFLLVVRARGDHLTFILALCAQIKKYACEHNIVILRTHMFVCICLCATECVCVCVFEFCTRTRVACCLINCCNLLWFSCNRFAAAGAGGMFSDAEFFCTHTHTDTREIYLRPHMHAHNYCAHINAP